jgi:hypothetical protein
MTARALCAKGRTTPKKDAPMSAGPLHLLKLCVGAARVEDLAAWQRLCAERARAAGRDPAPRHVTRMRPRRAGEVLAGGSLYWVIGGAVLARQAILGLEPVTDEDGTARCAILLDPEIIRTEAQPRRPFQGWRYLAPGDAPPDLPDWGAAEDPLPQHLSEALSAFGVVRRRA